MKTILAALSFFTRIPFWKLADLKKEHYQRLVHLWPLAGWLTGGTMVLTFWFSTLLFPISVSVILAIISRVLLTGVLHEDGFADFCDGFGGGKNRESVLKIMKDSHIGTYGVVGLVVYFFMLFTVLNCYFVERQTNSIIECFTLVNPGVWTNLSYALIFLVADPFAKWVSSNIINILPYARNEESAKNKLIYDRMTWPERVVGFFLGCLPAVILMPVKIFIPVFVSAFVAMVMILIFYKKIKGYTGDCCGACFIITELTFYITALAVF